MQETGTRMGIKFNFIIAIFIAIFLSCNFFFSTVYAQVVNVNGTTFNTGSKEISFSGTSPREITLVGSSLGSSFIKKTLIKNYGFSKTDFFTVKTFENNFKIKKYVLPRLTEVTLLPIKQFNSFTFNTSKVYALNNESDVISLSQKRKNIDLLDQVSLAFYCKVSSLSSSVKSERCNYNNILSGVVLKNKENSIATSSISLEKPVTKDSFVTNIFSTTTTVYITKYIPVPGPKGESGKNGKDGKDGVSISTTSSSYSNQSVFIPFYSSVGNTVSNLSNTTINSVTITGGTGNNLLLSSSTLTDTVFNGSSIFNGNVIVNNILTANTIVATSALFIDATTTNLTILGNLRDSNNLTGNPGQVLASNGTSTYWTYATGTIIGGSATSSTIYWNGGSWVENLNFFADSQGNLSSNGTLSILGTSTLATTTISNLSTPNANITDLTAGNALITELIAASSTINKLIASSATFTDATSTNFFSNLLTAVTGFFTNLVATNATTSNLVTGTLTATSSA
ncbi:MAG: hypothetical protein KBC41_03790, partial [Candidatus Pacebacteria bacterium]|nr:hypothetical protein [Candidatus Paceibacterota bacterium]